MESKIKQVLKNSIIFIFIDQFSKYLSIYIGQVSIVDDIISLEPSGNLRLIFYKFKFLLIVLSVLIFFIWKYRKNYYMQYPLVIILSGCISNLIDIIINRCVIDWIKVDSLIFNVADIYIIFGIILIVINLFRGKEGDVC